MAGPLADHVTLLWMQEQVRKLTAQTAGTAPPSHDAPAPTLTVQAFLSWVGSDYGYAASGSARRCDSKRTLTVVEEDLRYLFHRARELGADNHTEPFEWFCSNANFAKIATALQDLNLKPAR